MGCRSAIPLMILAALLPSGQLLGHALAPSLLELREADDGRVEVLWKTSALALPGVRLEPVLPAGCRHLGAPVLSYEETMAIRRWTADCDGLEGRTIAVRGLESSKTEVLLRVELADGRRAGGILRAREPSIPIPARRSSARVASDYLTLGVEHILLGFDHLLFVLALLLLVRGRRRLIITITAFTIGHSITLSLVALGYGRLPSAPVEAASAASILVLAVELARPQGRREGAMRRHPWAVASAFGLLHGMGFAGALAEVGLPQHDIPLALFAFNAGIEVGQLAFVAVVLLAASLRRRWSPRPPAWSLQVPVYLIGTLSAFWTFERLSQLL